MTQILAIIGALFVILSIVMLPQLARSRGRGNNALAVVGTVWIIAAFAAGSWLVCSFFWISLDLIYDRIGFIGLCAVLLASPVLFGGALKLLARRDGRLQAASIPF